MRQPCSNPLIRIIIDDEDGELPSINISPQIDDDDDEADHHAEHVGDSASEDEDHEHNYAESLSSSVESFMRHLDSLHPLRFSKLHVLL